MHTYHINRSFPILTFTQLCRRRLNVKEGAKRQDRNKNGFSEALISLDVPCYDSAHLKKMPPPSPPSLHGYQWQSKSCLMRWRLLNSHLTSPEHTQKTAGLQPGFTPAGSSHLTVLRVFCHYAIRRHRRFRCRFTTRLLACCNPVKALVDGTA